MRHEQGLDCCSIGVWQDAKVGVAHPGGRHDAGFEQTEKSQLCAT